MFTTAVGTQDGSSRFFRLTVAVSIALHVAAGAVFLVASFWKITKLNPKGQELVFHSTLPSEAPAAAAPSAPAAPEKGRIDHPQRTTQPDATRPVASATPAAEPASAPSGGVPGGTGDDPDGTAEGVGAGTGGPVGLGTEAIDIPEVPKIPPPTQELAPEQLEGQRVSGDPRILLPDGVLSMLRGQGVDRLGVAVRLCVDATGRPSSIGFARSSGYAQVDEVIRREIGRWRYSPWMVDGVATAACFPVVFQYKITD
jgi:hypothetical protein